MTRSVPDSRCAGMRPALAQSRRVEEIIELLAGLRIGLRGAERTRILTRLMNILRAYPSVPRVRPARDGFRVVHFTADRERLSDDDLWERRAVTNLLSIVPYTGKRPRIRRCNECGEWFFAAKREDQKFCGGNCRQHHHDSSPSIRKRKKDYMRGYRDLTSRRVFRDTRQKLK